MLNKLLSIFSPSYIDRTIPSEFAHLLSQKDYEFVLRCYLEKVKQHVPFKPHLHTLKVKKGIIFLSINEHIYQLALHNIVRQCAKEEKAKWKQLVEEHIDRILHIDKIDLQDFDIVAPLLLLRIYNKVFFVIEINGEKINYLENIVHQVDFEGTITAIVIHGKEGFHPVYRSYLEDWKITAGEAFAIAAENLMEHDLECKEYEFDSITAYFFFSTEHGATFILYVGSVLPEAIGKYGALVAIPAKGVGVAHPIEYNDLQTAVDKLAPVVIGFYRDETAPISQDFYWYYNGEFHSFRDKDNFWVVPQELSRLLSRVP